MIGNALIVTKLNKVVVVNGTMSDLVLTANGNFFARELEGVPLDSEALKVLGFKAHEIKGYMTVNVNKNSSIDYNVVEHFAEIETQDGIIYLNHIKHVHQMQNLYFALTGKDLNYIPT